MIIYVDGNFIDMGIGQAIFGTSATDEEVAEAQKLLSSTALRDWVNANQLHYTMVFGQSDENVTIKWRMRTGRTETIEILNVDGIPNASICCPLPDRDSVTLEQSNDMKLLLASTALRDWMPQRR